ncbi:alpha/beta hydrolase [Streptomyces albus subsp. chlorinus]|uniref:alpha/beta fold hydrolase n=1 Tax=Streptomyces albus TaxID=1888 RepID=UPI001570E011|nr:alpha/beta hydrolase [Streptomyces albus]NSC23751.1 alpha/beta hydrolase [Streptomyces albus subsp. chlorinus]
MSSTEHPESRARTARAAAPPAAPPPSEAGESGRAGEPRGAAEGETLGTVTLPGLTLAVRRPRRAAAQEPAGGSGQDTAAGGDTREAALYVHGLGGSSRNWSALMRELAGDVDGEAVDLPGFGDSPPPDDGDYSISAHARAVIRHLDAGDRRPVHLLGNSLGGAVATRVAAVRPDLVRTLTLVSPALPEVPPPRGAWPTAMLAVPGVAALFGRITRDWPAERCAGGVLGLCYGDPARVTPEDFAAAAAEYERRARLPYFWDAMARSTRGLVDAYTLSGQHALWRQAERVLAPTLLIYGVRDQLVAFRMARRASAAFRDSRLLAMPEAGHVAMMEYPEIVAGAVRELIHDAARAARRSDGHPAGAAPRDPGNPER